MDLSPARCWDCPPLLANVVCFILISLACLPVGRWLAAKYDQWGRLLGILISGFGACLTLLGVIGVFKSGVWWKEDYSDFAQIWQHPVLFGATRLVIPAVWLASAITIWIFAGRKLP